MKPPKTLMHEFVEFIPDAIEEGKIYVSIEYATAVHKCACGCGKEVVTPLSPTDWKLIFDGKTISLQEFKGRPVIVTFWATWCGPCVAESDELNKLARKYERLVILGLDVNDEPDALRQFLQKRPLSYTVLKAGKIEGPAATSYGVTSLPFTVVIAANGLVDFVAAGGLPEDTLETHVRSMLNP